MERDEVFKEQYSQPSDFKFTRSETRIFDDMVIRSVPFYEEIQRMVAELAADHEVPGSRIYDLGCSTGTTMIHMNTTVPVEIAMMGFDDSQAMLDKCLAKLKALEFQFL